MTTHTTLYLMTTHTTLYLMTTHTTLYLLTTHTTLYLLFKFSNWWDLFTRTAFCCCYLLFKTIPESILKHKMIPSILTHLIISWCYI